LRNRLLSLKCGFSDRYGAPGKIIMKLALPNNKPDKGEAMPDQNHWSISHGVTGSGVGVPDVRTVEVGAPGRYRFDQFHIDVVRNSTDDFNPLHDPNKWHTIARNPFAGTLVTVPQLECLIEYVVSRNRGSAAARIIDRFGLRFCNYHFTFAGALACGEDFSIRLRRAILKRHGIISLSDGVRVSSNGRTILVGAVRQTAAPLYLRDANLLGLKDLGQHADITYVPDTPYFLKRKYLSTGNAKTFITGSLADQAYYFDEVSGRVNFPDMMPVSYIASALYEKGAADNIDYRVSPVLCARHLISVDWELARGLCSNDPIHILVEGPTIVHGAPAFLGLQSPALRYSSFGLIRDNRILFRALVFLVPLRSPRAQ